MSQTIGVLTAGGDSPGLNAAIRGIGKAAGRTYDIRAIGFLDAFRGLMENRFLRLDDVAQGAAPGRTPCGSRRRACR